MVASHSPARGNGYKFSILEADTLTAKCVFCKIANHNSDAHIIFENQNISCFLDIDPINEGHILIIPKVHCANLDELPKEIVAEIIQKAQDILKALKCVYKFPGYSIMQNGGEFCDFGHLHFHIFPRYHKDGFAWTFGKSNPEAYSENVAKKIKAALQE